jgi:hypothetical protein
MKFPRIDASIVCFALVVVAAIPVATLRSRTYALGYDLGKLKQTEKNQRNHNVELKSAIARTQRSIRDSYLKSKNPGSVEMKTLSLPSQEHILNQNFNRSL